MTAPRTADYAELRERVAEALQSVEPHWPWGKALNRADAVLEVLGAAPCPHCGYRSNEHCLNPSCPCSDTTWKDADDARPVEAVGAGRRLVARVLLGRLRRAVRRGRRQRGLDCADLELALANILAVTNDRFLDDGTARSGACALAQQALSGASAEGMEGP